MKATWQQTSDCRQKVLKQAFNTVSEKETLLWIHTRDNLKWKAGLVTFKNNKIKPKGKINTLLIDRHILTGRDCTWMVTFYTEELLVSKLTNLLKYLSGNWEGLFRGQGQLNWVWFCDAVAACDICAACCWLNCWPQKICYTFFAAFPVGCWLFKIFAIVSYVFRHHPSISLTLSGLLVLVESCFVYSVKFKPLTTSAHKV